MILPNLFNPEHEFIYDETHRMSLVLHGTVGEYSYNVVTNAFDMIQVQFDIPEDHPLYGKENWDDNSDDAGCIQITELKTVKDDDGCTTWALRDIHVEDCYITADRHILNALMWPRVMMAVAAAYAWLETMAGRKNYIAGNGKSVT